ncbi:MAG: hypothetical protein AAB889_03035 [Patescibacteria group bacterium]
MIQFLILTAELGLLYFLSRWLTQTLYTFFLLIFKIRSIAMSLVTLLLFPGTVIHELSHLFVAEILGVRTGKLTLAPEEIRETNPSKLRAGVKAGSVAIAATDPIRRALIGIAPVFTGIGFLAGLSYWFQINNIAIITIIIFYIMFAVSNSMFSSKQDLKGFWPVAIIVSLIITAGFFAGLRFGLAGQAAIIAQQIIMSLTRSLAQVLAVNGGLLLVVSILIALLRKLTNTTPA